MKNPAEAVLPPGRNSEGDYAFGGSGAAAS